MTRWQARIEPAMTANKTDAPQIGERRSQAQRRRYRLYHHCLWRGFEAGLKAAQGPPGLSIQDTDDAPEVAKAACENNKDESDMNDGDLDIGSNNGSDIGFDNGPNNGSGNGSDNGSYIDSDIGFDNGSDNGSGNGSDNGSYVLERQEDGTYRIRVEADDQYLHLNGKDDQLLSNGSCGQSDIESDSSSNTGFDMDYYTQQAHSRYRYQAAAAAAAAAAADAADDERFGEIGETHAFNPNSTEFVPGQTWLPGAIAVSPPMAGKETEAWTEHKDIYGRCYYYNTSTRVSSWDKPEDKLNTTNWKEYETAEGHKYYHNSQTKESVWKMPSELIEESWLDQALRIKR